VQRQRHRPPLRAWGPPLPVPMMTCAHEMCVCVCVGE
jgi:hypothetical protein